VRRIALTQRVEVNALYGERRDALDQRWVALLRKIGLWPVLLPNNEDYCRELLIVDPPDGVLLTGGNSLAHCGGDAPERDRMERRLVEWALREGRPLLGVCRGMQLIQDYFGVAMRPVEGHVAMRHALRVFPDTRLASLLDGIDSVNAYHGLGSVESDFTGGDLRVCAVAEDGVVMAVEHRQAPLVGVMWHSEREEPFEPLECALIRALFDC